MRSTASPASSAPGRRHLRRCARIAAAGRLTRLSRGGTGDRRLRPAEAGRIADLAIALETELYAAELKPVESADPRNIYHPLPFADVRAQIPELDLGLYFEAIGYPQPERIIQTEPRYLPVLSRMLRERSLQDFKDHAALMLVLKYQGVLTTEFEEPTRALVEILTGTPVLPPRDERALALVTEKLGHPVSRLYPAIRRELVHRR